MAQFQYMNLGNVLNAANQYKAGKHNLERAKVESERVDEEFDENQRIENARWAAGATKVLQGLYEQNPDEFYAAADELGKVGIEKGIIDPQNWDPQLVTIEKVNELHNTAMVGLGGRKIRPDQKGVPAKIQQYEYYDENISGNPEAEANWNQATQVDKGMKTVKVPMPDGSEIMVNYDPQTGQGYDLNSGQTMIVRPGGGGEPLVYGEQGLIGPGQIAQAPQGFGRSQTPADKKTSELSAQREFDSLKVTEQNLTMMENAIRLEPMMEAAMGDANAWNTAWGSLLAGVPGSSAKDLASTVMTIKANIGFDRLQRMRAESPTGGALGQVAVQELVALQSTIANLDQSQSTEQFKENMKIALQQYRSWKQKWGEAIMREGTRDQKMRYYNMIPPGEPYLHPNGTWKVKGER